LGGTELHDVANFSWIDNLLTSSVISYEQDDKRYRLARTTAERLRSKGVDVQVVQDDIFRYRRPLDCDIPHIFYLDLLDTCKPDPYRREFKVWFDNEVIRPGDLLLITSYLGRNPGWGKVLQRFDADFRTLRVNSFEDKKRMYEKAHPIMVLNKALLDSGLKDELSLSCLGTVKYRDSSVMGLYGVVCEEGQANLAAMIANVSLFNTTSKERGSSF